MSVTTRYLRLARYCCRGIYRQKCPCERLQASLNMWQAKTPERGASSWDAIPDTWANALLKLPLKCWQELG